MDQTSNETAELINVLRSVESGGFWIPECGKAAAEIVENNPEYFEVREETLTGELIWITTAGYDELRKLEKSAGEQL